MKRVTLHKLIDKPWSNHNMAATGQLTPSGGKRTLHLLLALGIGLLASSSWLQAQTTIYVDANTNVSDNNDGSQDKPYKTVAAAITAASSGDSIILKSGTYAEALTIDKKLTIQGQDSTEVGSVITKPITVATTEPVVLSQLRISTSAGETGVEYSNEAGGTISLKEVALYSASTGLKINKETVTDKYTVNIEDSHISVSRYAMLVRGSSNNKITINHSKLEGWCAIYASLGQPDITITDSYLYGTNSSTSNFSMNWESNASSDAFATLILECTNNGTIQLEDTYVAALHTANAVPGQAVISFQMKLVGSVSNNFTNNTVTLKGTSSLYMDRGDVSNPVFAYSETKATYNGKDYIGENNKIVLADDWEGSITYGADNKKSSSVLYNGKTNEYRNFFVPAAIKDLSKFTVATDSVNMEIETSDDFNAAVTALNADPRKCSIQLAEAEYDFSNTLFTVNKNLTLSGTDTTKTILKGAIRGSAVEGETTSIAVKGVKFDYTPEKVTNKTNCTPVIEAHSGKVDLSVDNCLVNNNTAGWGSRFSINCKELQNVFQMDSAASGSMTIQNTTINLNTNNQIAVLSESKGSVINLINTTIQTAKDEQGNVKGNSCIGIYPHNNNISITMDNSSITLMNHYGIYIWDGIDEEKFSKTDENTLTNTKVYIKNMSSISAYGAIRVRSTKNTYLSVSGGSYLTGSTYNNGLSNDFGALVMQGNTGAKVDIEDSNIGTKFGKKETAGMTPILFNTQYGLEKGTIITLKGSSTVQTLSNALNPHLVKYGVNPDPETDGSFVVVEGNNVKFKDQYDKDCIVVNDLDGSFRNAAVSIANAVAYGDTYTYDGKICYDFAPIAFSGNIIMATDSTASKALASLNQAKMVFFTNTGNATDWTKYTIPDNIIINCKDAYLVTGEDAAKSFAETHMDKNVLYLKQGEDAFTTASVAGKLKITSDTEWNNANNANRSVEIADNATLTINVDMALDTVFMAETAQLKTSANVTARAVQLTYNVAKSWKAFGFPYTIGTVKDVEGTKDIQTVAQTADGIWTANIKATTPIFEVSQANMTPAATCIIAANANSKIVVTSSGSISLASKAEPEAPAIPTTTNLIMKSETENFKMVANPNTYDIQLTQTAYILSSDGTTFERKDNPTIKAFQSFVLADKQTTSTLRSLRVDETPTGNEITPVAGYYVQTGKGTITVHTAAPVLVTVVDIVGHVYFNDRVSGDYQIAVPAGIYVVNRQKVIVK